MSGPLSSPAFWATATSATAVGFVWTLPATTRVVVDLLRVVWLVLSNVR